MTKITKLMSALLLAACASGAYAQDAQKPDKIVLEQKIGSVMTSNGGEYESANVGEMLVKNESMMLSEGAKATVVYYYDNGRRKCTEFYEGPNTFIIDESCRKAAYMNGGQGKNVAIIVGAAVVAAAIIGNKSVGVMPQLPPPPISGSAR